MAQEPVWQYRVLFEKNHAGILRTSSDGTVLACNQPLADIVGVASAAELIGRKITDFYADPQQREGVRRSLLTGSLQQPVEVAVCRIDGSRRTVSVYFGIDESLDPPGLIGTVLDITARLEAEAEHQRLQRIISTIAREWTLIVDSIDFPIVMVDRAGTIRRLNKAARDHANAAYLDLIGAGLDRIFSPELHRAARGLIEELRPGVRSHQIEVRDERGRFWQIGINSMPGIEDDALAVVTARDITDFVELQASLRQSQVMSELGALVAEVAHQVRNPLFAMSATLEAFAAKNAGGPPSPYANILRGEIARLRDLMQALLSFARPEARELLPGPLAPVVAQAVHSCGIRAQERGVTVVNRVGWGLPQVRMDSARLREAFTNVIDNAIQHSPHSSAVQVEAEAVVNAPQQWVVCTIKDSGPGFPADAVSRIFEPFYTTRAGGTGLGLAIARKIVEEHGGEISACNAKTGSAVVTVSLPAYQPSPSAPPVESESHTSGCR